MTEAHCLAHSVVGEVCRIQGHLGHPSGGVLPGQGIVGGSLSIKLCSEEEGRRCEWVCTEQPGACTRQGAGLLRPHPTQSCKGSAEGRDISEGGGSNKPPPAFRLDSANSEYGISHTCWAER